MTAGSLSRAQVDGLRVLDNRPRGEEAVRTWRYSSYRNASQPRADRVNATAAVSLIHNKLAAYEDPDGRFVRITSAGRIAFAQALAGTTGRVVLGEHHSFEPASDGRIRCSACGSSYEEGTLWRADIDPCADGKPTGISEEQAHARATLAVWQILVPLYPDRSTDGS